MIGMERLDFSSWILRIRFDLIEVDCIIYVHILYA